MGPTAGLDTGEEKTTLALPEPQTACRQSSNLVTPLAATCGLQQAHKAYRQVDGTDNGGPQHGKSL